MCLRVPHWEVLCLISDKQAERLHTVWVVVALMVHRAATKSRINLGRSRTFTVALEQRQGADRGRDLTWTLKAFYMNVVSRKAPRHNLGCKTGL